MLQGVQQRQSDKCSPPKGSAHVQAHAHNNATHVARSRLSVHHHRWVCADRNRPHRRHFPGVLFLGSTMADSSVVREENPGQFHGTKQGWEDHVHQQNVKKGIERQDRRSANPNKGAVKKHGHGGKFTVDGPYHEADYAQAVPAAMDENDPNFVDPSDEQADEAAGVPVVEVPKVEAPGTDDRPSYASKAKA